MINIRAGGRQRVERGVELPVFQSAYKIYIYILVGCCRTTTTEDESVDHVGDVKASRVYKSIYGLISLTKHCQFAHYSLR